MPESLPHDEGAPPLTLQVGAATDVGRVRDHNEDSALAEGALFVVADGMGGHAAGEVASGLAIDTLREVADRSNLTAEDVVAQIRLANQRILEAVASHPDQRGMGTTLAGIALVVSGGIDHWAVFHLGDSRVYRSIDGALHQLTVDHSEVQELVDRGVISAAEARTHPLRNVVTRSLGTESGHQADVLVIPPYPGERFVVCTDGLTNELADVDIQAILEEHRDPQAAAEALVREAVVAGGRDNVTAVVVDLVGRSSDDAATSPRGADETTTPREL